MSKVAMPEPVAHIYPSDLKMFEHAETMAMAYSIKVGSAATGEKTVALITTDQAEAYKDATVREAQQWVSVDDRLPSNNLPVMFVVDCLNPSWKHLHGKVLGGMYREGASGGFSVPGLTIGASHWMPLPPPPK